MHCLKNTKRTFFNLFEIFSCEDCQALINYEYIYIGNNTINIYSFNKECSNKLKKHNFYKLFLKEMIYNEKDIFLELTLKEYLELFTYLPTLLDDCNLYIFIE